MDICNYLNEKSMTQVAMFLLIEGPDSFDLDCNSFW
uniref:Uncharacterized protein n=1 Tax=Rhizophora mucronata TaxID=61149 RepID=A0A2P2NQQ9_RHIMU